MHLCTIREFAFQRDGDGVDVYQDGAPVAFITTSGVDFRRYITAREYWLLAVILRLIDQLPRRSMTNPEVLHIVVGEAVYMGVTKADISVNEALREVKHA